MTRHGDKVPSLEGHQVRNQLRTESDGKAIKRLIAAREYLDRLSPAKIEAKYGWHEETVYGWLNRVEERDFEDALYDDKPPGRPAELSDDQLTDLPPPSTILPSKQATTNQLGVRLLLNGISSNNSTLPTHSGTSLG